MNSSKNSQWSLHLALLSSWSRWKHKIQSNFDDDNNIKYLINHFFQIWRFSWILWTLKYRKIHLGVNSVCFVFWTDYLRVTEFIYVQHFRNVDKSMKTWKPIQNVCRITTQAVKKDLSLCGAQSEGVQLVTKFLLASFFLRNYAVFACTMKNLQLKVQYMV